MAENRYENILQEHSKFELFLFVGTEMSILLLNHFGYAAINFFKFAIKDTLLAYLTFLCATLVGGFLMYFSTLALRKGLEYLKCDETYNMLDIAFVMQVGLSPIVGALALNDTLGWSLSLAGMLAIGVVSVILLFGLTLICGNQIYMWPSSRSGVVSRPAAENHQPGGHVTINSMFRS